jgi:hypothetical protein
MPAPVSYKRPLDAQHDLQKAADAALQAFTLMACAGNPAENYIHTMEYHLQKAARSLGYDLVRRDEVRIPAHAGPDDGQYLASIGGGRL